MYFCCCMYCLFCVIPCIVCVYMCTELLPPGGYPIAVKCIIYHIIQSPCSPNMAPCNCIICSLNLQRLKIRWTGNNWTQDTIAVMVHPQYQFERYFSTGKNCRLRNYSMNELTLDGINPLKYSSYQMHHPLKHKNLNFFHRMYLSHFFHDLKNKPIISLNSSGWFL
jgi:hypothetical protein